MGFKSVIAHNLPRRFRSATPAEVVTEFHKLFYSKNWSNMTWLGVTTQKNPADLWIYQELLFEVKPDLVIETGTMFGGSAYFLACVCDLLRRGKVVSIDIEPRDGRPRHPRIEYITGSSIDPDILARLRANAFGTILVLLDSDHSAEHVRAELDAYASFVTPGSYLVVEDTNIHGHPVCSDLGPGPMEALDDWLPHHPEFAIDRTREKFLVTFNPGGFLRRTGIEPAPGVQTEFA